MNLGDTNIPYKKAALSKKRFYNVRCTRMNKCLFAHGAELQTFVLTFLPNITANILVASPTQNGCLQSFWKVPQWANLGNCRFNMLKLTWRTPVYTPDDKWRWKLKLFSHHTKNSQHLRPSLRASIIYLTITCTMAYARLHTTQGKKPPTFLEPNIVYRCLLLVATSLYQTWHQWRMMLVLALHYWQLAKWHNPSIE